MTRPAAPHRPGTVIVLLGAESTGKTTLARGLFDTLAAQGRRVAVVEEFLREFCLREGRTPRRDEQAAIALTQSQRISEAARHHDIVVADTSALMIAVYSQLLFDDDSLVAVALAEHDRYRLTLLTALDLPWVFDGLMRDGEHARAPVDALLRTALQDGGVPYAIVTGFGEHRLANAARAVDAVLRTPLPGAPRWRHLCAECGDPDCERHLFKRNVVS
ncbi:MAG TPA: ATP-binding protein [Burkholderiaceae bacterium]|nr:ATP-binding protein [Burkholderiaceae bacterium]